MIRQNTSKIITRMARNGNNQNFQIDLKKVLEVESSTVNSTVAENLEKDLITKWSGESKLPEDVKGIVNSFKDRFIAPTELPPERPEDMEIKLLSNSTVICQVELV